MSMRLASRVSQGRRRQQQSPPQGGRVDLATIPSLIAAWDFSADNLRTPTNSSTISSLTDRSAAARPLTANPGAGGTVPVVLGDRDYLKLTAGSQQRLNPAAGVADNIFAGGGMLSVTFRTPTDASESIIAAKWNMSGWVLQGLKPDFLSLDAYGGFQDFRFTRHEIRITPLTTGTEWYLLEIEWNSDTPYIVPVVRINGGSIAPITTFGAVETAIDDSVAVLSVGNRNWGDGNTPWLGEIGELLLFADIPTTEQKDALREDMMTHWGVVPTPPPEPLTPIDLGQYTMVFNEDFTAPLSRRVLGDASTDGNLWDTSMGGGTIRWMGDTPERQIYVEPEYAGTKGTPLGINPFSVANSVLTITCDNASAGDAPYLSGKEYTSGLITTAATYSKLYGYFEMRARMTDVGVTAAWPAFWLLFHGTGPSEFDIVEAYGVNTYSVFQTTHQVTNAGTIETPLDWTTGWHTYGLKWTEQELVYYLDGQPTGRIPNNTFTAGYIIANLALEGRADRVPNPADFPIHMEIDWIRVYDPI